MFLHFMCSIHELSSELTLVSSIMSLPILEPLTANRIGKVCLLALGCMHAAVIIATGNFVLTSGSGEWHTVVLWTHVPYPREAWQHWTCALFPDFLHCIVALVEVNVILNRSNRSWPWCFIQPSVQPFSLKAGQGNQRGYRWGDHGKMCSPHCG